ncbi:MAG: hypothetical protein WDZ41_05030 [Candidatus Babeliales bacterium]
MKIKRNVNGSGLIFIIIIINFFALYISLVWRTTSYSVDLSLVNLQSEQIYAATQSLMLWAIAASKQNYEQFYEQTKTQLIHIPIKRWPLDYETKQIYQGAIEISNLEKVLHIKVSLTKNNELKCALACDLMQFDEENSQNFFVIKNWHRN